MATNIEIIEEIGELKSEIAVVSTKLDARGEKLDRIHELAERSDRALRGEKNMVGLVARVKTIEDRNKWLYGIVGGVSLPMLIDWGRTAVTKLLELGN